MILEAKNIKKVYTDSSLPLEVLNGVDFSVGRGEIIGISGPSGSGKSTFLHILGGLDKPTSGSIFCDGRDIFELSENELALFRNKSIGFVFQFYHLLKEFTALENVMMPCLIGGMARSKASDLAVAALEEVGLRDRFEHLPSTLSGGEQQRVAVARAVVMGPKVVLADEPTGNLDSESGEQVMEYLLKVNKNHGSSLVLVSHNSGLLDSLPLRYVLKDGKFNNKT